MANVFGLNHSFACTVAPGGAAGAHTVPSGHFTSSDTLLAVRHLSADLSTNTDITSEFSISGTNTLDNTAGTDTSGGFLLIVYAQGEDA